MEAVAAAEGEGGGGLVVSAAHAARLQLEAELGGPPRRHLLQGGGPPERSRAERVRLGPHVHVVAVRPLGVTDLETQVMHDSGVYEGRDHWPAGPLSNRHKATNQSHISMLCGRGFWFL